LLVGLGGAHVVTVNDLSETDLGGLQVDLDAFAGDGETDRVVVNATDGDDTIGVDGDADSAKVSGLAPTIMIVGQEPTSDRLEVNTLAGTDTLDSAGLAGGAIQLRVDGVLVP